MAGSARSFLSNCSLMLPCGRFYREAHALQFADRVSFYGAQSFAHLVHRIQDGREHQSLVAPACFIEERITFDVGAPLQEPHQLERHDHHDRSQNRGRIEARPAGHPDGRHDPYAGCAGEPADTVPIVQDQPRAQEPDALHDIRRHLALVGIAIARQHGGKQREEGRPHADEQVGPHPRVLAANLALQADHRSQQARHEQSPDGAVHHQNLLQSIEGKGGGMCGIDHHASFSLPDATTAEGRNAG